MDKYLYDLNKELCKRLSNRKRRSVMADYHEYCLDMKKEGKTEQEICNLLGSPAAVAKAVADDMRVFGRLNPYIIVRVFLVMVVLLLMFSQYYSSLRTGEAIMMNEFILFPSILLEIAAIDYILYSRFAFVIDNVSALLKALPFLEAFVVGMLISIWFVNRYLRNVVAIDTSFLLALEPFAFALISSFIVVLIRKKYVKVIANECTA